MENTHKVNQALLDKAKIYLKNNPGEKFCRDVIDSSDNNQLQGLETLNHYEASYASSNIKKDVKDYLKTSKKKCFSDILIDKMIEKGFKDEKDSVFYKSINIDRKLWNKIMNQDDYHPNISTALKCCIGLHLDVNEANELLNSANYSINGSNIEIRLVKFCLENKCYDTKDIDDIFYDNGCDCLFSLS